MGGFVRWRKVAPLLVALTVFLAAGCGGNKGPGVTTDKDEYPAPGPADERAESLFRESLASLTASSFRLWGEMDMRMSMQEGDRIIPVEMHISIREDVQQVDGVERISGEMEASGEGINQVRLRVFLIDDTLYYEHEGQWFRSGFVAAFNPLGGTGQLMTSQSIALMLESAESLTVEEARSGEIVFGLTLGNRYFEQALEQMEPSLDQAQRETLERMFSTLSYRLTCTVDSKRSVVTHLVMEMRGDRFEFMPGYFMSMDVLGDFTLTDHGADLRVELPPEAEEAQPIDVSGINPF